jgi:hypothetical protein
MKRSLAILGFFLSASAACAEPFVAPSFDRPLPRADNVESLVPDVPSSQFPTFWQTRTLNGFRYKILASSEGMVGPTDPIKD